MEEPASLADGYAQLAAILGMEAS